MTTHQSGSDHLAGPEPGARPGPDDNPAGEARPQATGTKILATLAVIALAGGVFTVASLALFTDQQAVGGNAFTTGSIDLLAAPAATAITASAMVPGDQVTAPINVANTGTLEFRYSITSTTDEDTLANELVLTVKSGVTTCDDAGWSADGTVLYSGILGSTATINLVGDPATGSQAGDRVLAATANEDLCFNVTLPTAAPNSVQGLTSTATFTFDAEQTANNP